ncbi:hypothetical protein H5410_030212 [Solanum commersonii]|uniref:Uncharacterized protein n=1 Tax=Solanum commersonii TaxID=4109 RepID=A0A9J5YF32_SOLCO|nr:hypothetical protein H5410_030212 [Solanum commersonii]
MNHIEDLQYAVIGKFTYEWSDLEELRKIIPSQSQFKQALQAAKGQTLQKGGAIILSSGKVVGDPGNWKVVRDKRGKTNISPQLTTVVENKFEALAQDENTMTCTSTSNTNVIENNDTRDKGNPSQDKKVEDTSSTKEWVTKAFGSVLQGDDQQYDTHTISGSAKSDGNKSTQISKEPALDEQEVSQRSKVRSNEKHGEIHTTDDEQNEDMDNVVISSDSPVKNYTSPEKHGIEHTSTEQQHESNMTKFSKSVNSENITVAVQGSNNSTTVTMRKNHEIMMGDNMAVVVEPITLQSDEYQVVRVHSDSPNNTLHDILIHKDANSEPKDLAEIKGIECAIFSELNEEKIYNDADISPRVMKSVKSDRNGMKQGDVVSFEVANRAAHLQAKLMGNQMLRDLCGLVIQD